MEKSEIIITDQSVLSVAEVHYSLEDWEFTKNNKATYDTKYRSERSTNSQTAQAIKMACVAADFKAELDQLKMEKRQIDIALSDLRAEKTETNPIIEPVRSVQTEDRKDTLEVIQEPKIEEDNVDTRDLNMTDENANEMMLPTSMLKDLSNKEKKTIKKLEKRKRKDEKKLQKVLEKKAKLYQQTEERKQKAEEKEMWKTWHNDVLKEVKNAKKEKERSRKELMKERKEIEKQENKNKKYKSHGKYVTEKLLTKDDTDNEPSKDVTENVPKKVANENEPTKDVTENKSTNGVAENEPRKDENKNNPSRDVTENEPTKDEMVSKKVEALFYVGGSNTVALECNNKTQKKTLGKRIRDFFSCFPCMRKVRST